MKMLSQLFENAKFFHGSPSGEFKGHYYGVHVGTHLAAKQALESKIGIKSDGSDWDGTTEYGKTLLAGTRSLERLESQGFWQTGYNCGAPEEDYYPTQRTYRAKYSDGSVIPFEVKPKMYGVRIKGKMSNSTYSPMGDTKANSLMKAFQKKGNARRGYYYTNDGEDAGSVSAVVPNGDHLEVLESFIQLFESPSVPKPDDLKDIMKEVILGKDKDGFYVYTHRCRSKSYPTPHDIPKGKIEFVGSTG